MSPPTPRQWADEALDNLLTLHSREERITSLVEDLRPLLTDQAREITRATWEAAAQALREKADFVLRGMRTTNSDGVSYALLLASEDFRARAAQETTP